ncbi:hypothetical protein AB6A40_004430 [Gnathostoma spinigerum]|uniref:Uncharacterized protein n=1 Tax=Gnathostoma spinigerum TaxID=75299 RepID=A0ABD6EDJ8_9BILA
MTAKVSRLEKKIALNFENKEYYEAHQGYRMLYNRLAAENKWSEQQDKLYTAVLQFIAVNEFLSAFDLAELFVSSLHKAKTPVSDEVLDRLEEIMRRLPAKLPNDSAAKEKCIDKRSTFLSLSIQWSMMVGQKKQERERGNPELHRRFATVFWQENNYYAARRHFMLSENSDAFAAFLIEFQQEEGLQGEFDLFIAQAVLQLFADRRYKFASSLLTKYCKDHPLIHGELPNKFPLLNFLHFLSKAIPTRKLVIFSKLVESYEVVIMRDPRFYGYLDKIGQNYFHLPPKEANGGGHGLLGTLLRGLICNNAANENDHEDDMSDEEDLKCALGEDGYVTASSSVDESNPPSPMPDAKRRKVPTNDDDMELD